MAVFPFFFELSGKKGVVIGGGKIALEKVEALSRFGADLNLIAPEILPEIDKYTFVNCIRKGFSPSDLNGADYCIAATGNRAINVEIYRICKAKKIPINVVDNQDLCDFIFPSVVKRGKLVAGITSSGASPAVAVHLRKEFEKIIPDDIEEILDYLAGIRPYVKEKILDPTVRHRIFKAAGAECLRLGRSLKDEELEEILKSV
ncbi:MAG: bifunctional precorrin-2 dehydrogenase/sirohydrochlorin ferrochelatase [Lachnospiraceae bacterium]|nr:bifunctional precorrin-2 dehydrogenase/sirohydrochlorin ferrochelatase [Lachnospiraceae bacterium]